MKRLLLIVPLPMIMVLLVLTGCGNTVPIEQYDEAVAARTKAEAELATQIELNENLNSQLAGMETDLWVDLETELANLQTELDVEQVRIAELEAKCPPRMFKDVSELEAWLADQPDRPEATDAVLWLSHACDLQQKALGDGYIINVECTSEDDVNFTIWCTVILQDDSYYFWDPDTDDIYYWLDVSYF